MVSFQWRKATLTYAILQWDDWQMALGIYLENKASLKIICFSWIALHEAYLAQDNLYRRKIQTVDRCFICLNNLESNRHLLLDCPIVTDIWGMFFSIFGLKWVIPQSIKEAYECWSKWKVDKSIRTLADDSCLYHLVCLDRKNRRYFDGISTPTYILEAKCLL